MPRDQPGPQVQMVQMELRDQLDRLGHKEKTVHKDRLDRLDHKEMTVHKDQPDPLDHKEMTVHKDQLDRLDHKELVSGHPSTLQSWPSHPNTMAIWSQISIPRTPSTHRPTFRAANLLGGTL